MALTFKRTLLNTLAGMTKPLGGQCTLRYQASAEETPQQIKPREQMMYVFQHPDSHFFFDTVAEELTQLGTEMKKEIEEEIRNDSDASDIILKK